MVPKRVHQRNKMLRKKNRRGIAACTNLLRSTVVVVLSYAFRWDGIVAVDWNGAIRFTLNVWNQLTDLGNKAVLDTGPICE